MSFRELEHNLSMIISLTPPERSKSYEEFIKEMKELYYVSLAGRIITNQDVKVIQAVPERNSTCAYCGTTYPPEKGRCTYCGAPR